MRIRFGASYLARCKKKKKKSRGSKSPQGQQAATGMDQEQEQQEHVAPQRNDTTVIIGDSIIKGLRNDLLSRATQRRVTVRSFPGASSSDMKHYLQPSLQLKPSEIILHAGTNDLRDSSPRAVAEKLVDLGNLVSSSSPSTKATISALTQRFDDESLGEKSNGIQLQHNHQIFFQPKGLGPCPTPEY